MATTNHQEPSRVPVHGDITTWAISYADAKTSDLLDDPQLLAEKWTSFLDDIYFDTQHSMGLSTPLRMMETLGSEALFISSDSVTIQHQESCHMEASDYPALIDDPKNFLINEYPLKKFSVLNDPSKPRYEILKKCAAQTLNWITANALVEKTAREEYGVFPLATGACRAYAPLDVIFDRLRGFKGLSLDMKRCPELVIAACEAIYSVYIEDTINGFPGNFPFAMSPLHSPAFIGPKKFEKFFGRPIKRQPLKLPAAAVRSIRYLKETTVLTSTISGNCQNQRWSVNLKIMRIYLPPKRRSAMSSPSSAVFPWECCDTAVFRRVLTALRKSLTSARRAEALSTALERLSYPPMM